MSIDEIRELYLIGKEEEKARLDQANTLIKLLNKRFKSLSPEYEDKILNGSREAIVEMIENIFDIEAIDEIDNYIK